MSNQKTTSKSILERLELDNPWSWIILLGFVMQLLQKMLDWPGLVYDVSWMLILPSIIMRLISLNSEERGYRIKLMILVFCLSTVCFLFYFFVSGKFNM